MAEETDLSRTEPASPRRLQQARSAGDVPRSAEFTGWAVLLTALGVLGWQAPSLLQAFQDLLAAAFLHAAQPLSSAFLEAAQSALWAVVPVLAAIFVAALVAPMLLSGWVYAPKVAEGDLARANPFKPFSRFLSADAWFDGMRALLKLLLAVAAVWWALASGWSDLPMEDGHTPLPDFAAWVGRGVLALAGALALTAALDAGWRWWRYLRRHAMTWQEVVAEAREAEGSPEMRVQLRSRQQLARRGRGPLTNPLPQAGEGASARPKAGPLPNPLPRAGEGANAKSKSIDEVIG
jgi:flagellar biosynthetic protein FlhB